MGENRLLHQHRSIGNCQVKKCRLGPQNFLGSLGPKKLLKIVNCQKIVLSQME